MSTTGRATVRRAQRDERRAAEEVPASKRRTKKTARHTRQGPFRDHQGDRVVWHTTKESPWVRKARTRRHNRVARAARKANR